MRSQPASRTSICVIAAVAAASAALLTATLVGPALPDAAAADESAETAEARARVTVTRLSGDPLRAQAWVGVAAGELTLATGDGPVSVPLDDVIEISLGTDPDPVQASGPESVALDLWSGEEIRGQIIAGDEYGLTIRNPILGDIRVDVDAVAGLRFPYRLAQLAEPPKLGSGADSDIVHLVGGDRIDCTLTAFGTDALTCSTSSSDELAIDHARVTAVRLMPTGEKLPSGAALSAVLRDGSRLSGSVPELRDGRLHLQSLSGFEASAALDDVVSVLMLSDAFRYLSDLPAPTLVVKPFWKPVAGDPAQIYAPRMNRAFSGGLLTAGGRTWLRGIGVFSGTSLTWKLDEAWSEFRTQVAVDDRAGPLGGVVFVIEVDGKERWRSDFVVAATDGRTGEDAPTGPVRVPRIDVKGAKALTLRVLAGTEDDPYPIQDEADWLGAMLVR